MADVSDDLAAFMNARLKEKESDALESKNAPEGALRFLDADRWTEALSWQADEDLVLRRVEALRRVLALHSPEPGQHPDFCGHDLHKMPCPTLRILGAVDSDHPDYDPAWKP